MEVKKETNNKLKRTSTTAAKEIVKKLKLVSPVNGTKKKPRPVDTDSDEFPGFESSPTKKVKISQTPPKPAILKTHTSLPRFRDKRVLSTDVEDLDVESPTKAKNGIDIWCEVYAEKERKWICVDIFKGKVDCASVLYVSEMGFQIITPDFLQHFYLILESCNSSRCLHFSMEQQQHHKRCFCTLLS